jgi:hypothetical protein
MIQLENQQKEFIELYMNSLVEDKEELVEKFTEAVQDLSPSDLKEIFEAK